MTNKLNETPEPYTVLISIAATAFAGGGQVGSRITGSIPRKFGKRDLASLRRTLASGRAIEVVTASRESWLAMRDALMAQIGSVKC